MKKQRNESQDRGGGLREMVQSEFQEGNNGQHWPRSQGVMKGKYRSVPIALALRQVIDGLNNSSLSRVKKMKVGCGPEE